MFEGPRLKLRRAHQHLADLERLLDNYGKEVNFSYEPIEGDDTADRMVFSPRPPVEEISVLTGDCIHNARSSLDIMVCDIARYRGKSTDKLKFPFAADEMEYDSSLLTSPLKRLGQDVMESFRFLAPYKGGDILLRGLHDLDIADKHHLALPVVGCSFFRMDKERMFFDITGLTALDMNKFDDTLRILEIDGGYCPRQFREYIQKDNRSPATALFADDLPLAKCHVVPTLTNILKHTGEIIDIFEATLTYQAKL